MLFLKISFWLLDKILLLVTAVAYYFGLIVLLHHLGIDIENFWWIGAFPATTTTIFIMMENFSKPLVEE